VERADLYYAPKSVRRHGSEARSGWSHACTASDNIVWKLRKQRIAVILVYLKEVIGVKEPALFTLLIKESLSILLVNFALIDQMREMEHVESCV
jgi:hypothetical protein